MIYIDNVRTLLVPGSYDRKGFARFATDRLRRLGVPTLVYIAVITLFMGLVQLHQPFTVSTTVASPPAPALTWFAVTLLFSLVYAATRLLFPGAFGSTSSPPVCGPALLIPAQMTSDCRRSARVRGELRRS